MARWFGIVLAAAVFAAPIASGAQSLVAGAPPSLDQDAATPTVDRLAAPPSLDLDARAPRRDRHAVALTPDTEALAAEPAAYDEAVSPAAPVETCGAWRWRSDVRMWTWTPAPCSGRLQQVR